MAPPRAPSPSSSSSSTPIAMVPTSGTVQKKDKKKKKEIITPTPFLQEYAFMMHLTHKIMLGEYKMATKSVHDAEPEGKKILRCQIICKMFDTFNALSKEERRPISRWSKANEAGFPGIKSEIPTYVLNAKIEETARKGAALRRKYVRKANPHTLHPTMTRSPLATDS